MIRLDNISKQNGHHLLFIEASAALQRGEKVGLVGPNGSGKTTLFRMITGEEQPDEGQVSVDRGVSIGYFSQDVGEMSGRSAGAEVMDGAGPGSSSTPWPTRTGPTRWSASSSVTARSRDASRNSAAMRWRGGRARC